MSTNTTFCRAVLREVIAEVRHRNPEIETRKAWVWCAGRGRWEFHGPDGYYWHGRADNAYDARAKGWDAWLESNRESTS